MPHTPQQRSKQLRLPNPTFSPTPLPLLRLQNKLNEPFAVTSRSRWTVTGVGVSSDRLTWNTHRPRQYARSAWQSGPCITGIETSL